MKKVAKSTAMNCKNDNHTVEKDYTIGVGYVGKTNRNMLQMKELLMLV